MLWLTLFRTVASTVLLVTLVARLLSEDLPEALSLTEWASFLLLGGLYGLTLLTSVLVRAGRVSRPIAWTQVVADVLLASALVALTGGNDSPFTFVYLLAIISSSVLLFRRGAFVALGLSVALYLLLLLLVAPSAGSTARFLSQTAIQILAQTLVAVLTGFLAEQLVRAGGELTATEEHLERVTDLRDRIVEAMPSGLLTFDTRGRLTFANPAALAILALDRLPTGMEIERLLPGALGAVQGRRTELEVDTEGGSRVLGLTQTRLGAPEGESLVVFQDLTELRRAQTELKRIDQLATLGRVSAQLAHEIRNPLAAMRGSAQLIQSSLAPSDPQQSLVGVIVREADRLEALVESYLRLARPPPPVLCEVRLDRLASETVDLLKNDPGNAGRRIEEALAPVSAMVDAGQIKQVVLNLLRNALLVTPSTRSVRVFTRETPEGAALGVWDPEGAIAPEDQERIFTPFFTTSSMGTGLGLSTARSIVHGHHGQLIVESSPQRGTTFTVILPKGTS